MAISHSDHLFVSAAFVFCLLSSLLVVHASDIHDYTGARQFKKSPAVSKHRSNTQRLANYNWKPPDKYHGPREESTAEKPGAEFTKPEDPEQRATDPRIKKMQEISRQKREKWASYKRNENGGKLALDDVVETARAGKLTNDESIATPFSSKSVESDESAEEGSGVSENLFEESAETSEAHREIKSNADSIVPETLTQHPPAREGSARVLKDRQNFPRLDSIHRSDADGPLSKKKLNNDRWATSAKNPHKQLLRETSVPGTRQRHESDEAEGDAEKRNEITKREKNKRKEEQTEEAEKKEEEKEDSLLGSMVDSHPRKRQSRKNPRYSKKPKKVYTPRSFGEFAQEDSNDGSRHPKKLTPAMKEYPGRSSVPRKNGARNDKRDDERIVTIDPLTRKSAEVERDEAGRKDATDWASLNHEGSPAPGRWGMSVSSPPAEFLRDVTSRSIHRENKEKTTDESDDEDDEKGGRDRQIGRWGMSVSSPPKEFLEDISMHREHGAKERGTAAKSRSRPAAARFPGDRAHPLSQSRRSLQTDHPATERPTGDEHGGEFAKTFPSSSSSSSFGDVPRTLYNFANRRALDAWRDYYPASTDLGRNQLLERLLVRATSQSNIDFKSDVADIPLCRVRIPIALLRVNE